jgi:XRE family aerobic/anaerobic benzoate catabolism transcriptional regulator
MQYVADMKKEPSAAALLQKGPKPAAQNDKRRQRRAPPSAAEAQEATSRDELLASLGALVRALREKRGLTRRQLAQSSGLSERFLADLESGSGNISVARLAQLAQALGSRTGALLAAAERGERDPGTVIDVLLLEAVTPHLARLSREDLAEVQRWLRARFGRRSGQVIALLGLRGAGKSTVGKRLADRLGLPFVELDELVEKAAGLSLAGIFSLHGEAYYRRLAREVLARFLEEGAPAVLATGGSVVADREAFRLLQKSCRTVWLQATPEDHWERVLRQGDVRPSAASPHAQEELRALLKAREPLYAQAELSVDTSRLGLEGTVEEVTRQLGQAAA